MFGFVLRALPSDDLAGGSCQLPVLLSMIFSGLVAIWPDDQMASDALLHTMHACGVLLLQWGEVGMTQFG